MNGNVLSLGAACALLLVGCGGGSSTPASENMVLTGVFVDSPVEGATYATQTQSGTTNAAGEFSYLAGEQVTFSIGAMQLPTVAAAAQVTPVDIAAGSGNPTAMTTNIARLLQSLDQDGNPDNGITIPSAAAASAASLNFDVSTDDFANDAAVINLVANSGSVTTALISADAANAHLNSTLGTTPQVNTDGLWLRVADSDTGTGLPDYSLLDGLNITRYNSRIPSDGIACYTTSANTAISLGNNRYQLNVDNSPVFYSAVRVGEALEVTFDGEPTLIYPLATGVDAATLSLCEDNSSDGGDSSQFNLSDLIAGSPWYSIRVYDNGQPAECGSKFDFADAGVLSGATSNGSFGTGTYSLSSTGLLTIQTSLLELKTGNSTR